MVRPLRVALWLLALCPHATAAWVFTSSSSTTALSATRHNILEDAPGHINRDLAERIWQWEQDRRVEQDLPKLDYSIRAGLRLVDNLVKELGGTNDLVQEGLATLLDVLGEYRGYRGVDFEIEARREIKKRLAAYQESKPIPLPAGVRTVVREAKKLKLKATQAGRDANWSEIAQQLELPVERLHDYMAMDGNALSMESTVEIVRPESVPEYRDQGQWELREGLLLDNGKMVNTEENVEEYMDEMQELEGNDEAWVRQEQLAGPLQELIPDREPSPDDLVLREMIRNDLSEFLKATLDEQEVKIVRLSFGLENGKSASVAQIATELGLQASEVSTRLHECLEKLRASYTSRYLDPYDGDVDSV